MAKADWQEVVRSLEEHLAREMPFGYPRSWDSTVRQTVSSEVREPVESRAVENVITAKTAAADTVQEDIVGRYQALQLQAQSCSRCRLAETRQSVVFGSGQVIRPPIAFVGEGPGAEEDKRGEPFVGKAGELLTAAITKGLKLRREDVYICNVVKCRPPENRTPLPDEVQQCKGYLEQQLRLIQPRVIVTLGGPALAALTSLEGGITKLRGSWRDWENIPLMPTFHPAYILRNPTAKREFWADLQLVMKRLAGEDN